MTFVFLLLIKHSMQASSALISCVGSAIQTSVPQGIYDITTNIGYLTIGTIHDTAKFVCDNIARVWTEHLQWQYPNAGTICLLCDGGGANSCLHHRDPLNQHSNLTNRSTSYLTIACLNGTISSRRFNMQFHPKLFFSVTI